MNNKDSLREAIYGFAYKVHSYPKDFDVVLNKAGVEELVNYITSHIEETKKQTRLNVLTQLKADYINHTLTTHPSKWIPIVNFIDEQLNSKGGSDEQNNKI